VEPQVGTASASGFLRSPACRLEHSEELDDAADEEALFVDLHPDARRCRKDDVVARLDGHLDAGLLPPIQAGPDGEDDALLRRRVVRSRRDDEPGSAHPILIELLDHHLVEERSELVTNGLNRLTSRTRFHGR
jgi:hypothetical protein